MRINPNMTNTDKQAHTCGKYRTHTHPLSQSPRGHPQTTRAPESRSNDPSIPIGTSYMSWDLLTGRANSRLIHCQQTERGNPLDNAQLLCQVSPHNSPVEQLFVTSRALCGSTSARGSIITTASCGQCCRAVSQPTGWAGAGSDGQEGWGGGERD